MTTPTQAPPSEADILRRAAALIEVLGFYQGAAFGPKGEVCMIAALSIAAPPTTYNPLVTRQLREHLGVSNLAVWSDTRTSAAEVTAALRDCADSLDAA